MVQTQWATCQNANILSVKQKPYNLRKNTKRSWQLILGWKVNLLVFSDRASVLPVSGNSICLKDRLIAFSVLPCTEHAVFLLTWGFTFLLSFKLNLYRWRPHLKKKTTKQKLVEWNFAEAEQGTSMSSCPECQAMSAALKILFQMPSISITISLLHKSRITTYFSSYENKNVQGPILNHMLMLLSAAFAEISWAAPNGTFYIWCNKCR